MRDMSQKIMDPSVHTEHDSDLITLHLSDSVRQWKHYYCSCFVLFFFRAVGFAFTTSESVFLSHRYQIKLWCFYPLWLFMIHRVWSFPSLVTTLQHFSQPCRSCYEECERITHKAVDIDPSGWSLSENDSWREAGVRQKRPVLYIWYICMCCICVFMHNSVWVYPGLYIYCI